MHVIKSELMYVINCKAYESTILFLNPKSSNISPICKVKTSNIETSPLIPEWANQTDNPAFFQNLDIPTFLRRRGSSSPRQ